MNSTTYYIDKFRFGSVMGWLATVLIAVVCFRYIKTALVYILMKCYEIFVQHKNS